MASTSLEYLVTLHEYVKQSGGKTFQCYVKGGFIAGGSFFVIFKFGFISITFFSYN